MLRTRRIVTKSRIHFLFKSAVIIHQNKKIHVLSKIVKTPKFFKKDEQPVTPIQIDEKKIYELIDRDQYLYAHEKIMEALKQSAQVDINLIIHIFNKLIAKRELWKAFGYLDFIPKEEMFYIALIGKILKSHKGVDFNLLRKILEEILLERVHMSKDFCIQLFSELAERRQFDESMLVVDILRYHGYFDSIEPFEILGNLYMDTGNIYDAMALIDEIHEAQLVPPFHFYERLANNRIKYGEYSDAESIIFKAIQDGYYPHASINKFIHRLCRDKEVHSALNFIGECTRYGLKIHSSVLNLLMKGALENEQEELAHEIFETMKDKNVPYTNETFFVFITHLARRDFTSRKDLQKAAHYWKLMKKQGLVPSFGLYRLLILGYQKNFLFEASQTLLEEMCENNIVQSSEELSFLIKNLLEIQKDVNLALKAFKKFEVFADNEIRELIAKYCSINEREDLQCTQ